MVGAGEDQGWRPEEHGVARRSARHKKKGGQTWARAQVLTGRPVLGDRSTEFESETQTVDRPSRAGRPVSAWAHAQAADEPVGRPVLQDRSTGFAWARAQAPVTGVFVPRRDHRLWGSSPAL